MDPSNSQAHLASGGYDLSERASHLSPGRHAKGVRLGIEVDLQKDRLKRWGTTGTVCAAYETTARNWLNTRERRALFGPRTRIESIWHAAVGNGYDNDEAAR